jgi:hypothetical protein
MHDLLFCHFSLPFLVKMRNDGSWATFLQFECSLLPIPTPGSDMPVGGGDWGGGGVPCPGYF